MNDAIPYPTFKQCMGKISGLPYVCLFGYQHDIENSKKLLVLLTTEPEPLIDLMGLRFDPQYHSSQRKGNHRFLLRLRSAKHVNREGEEKGYEEKKIIVAMKGHGIFTDKFEGDVLARRYLNGDRGWFYIPSDDHQLYITLYNLVIHRGLLTQEERTPIIAALKTKFSVFMKSTYPEFGCYHSYLKPAASGQAIHEDWALPY